MPYNEVRDLRWIYSGRFVYHEYSASITECQEYLIEHQIKAQWTLLQCYLSLKAKN